MSSAAEVERRMDVAEFLRWNEEQEERWELVDGFATRMMAGGKHRHNIATSNVAYAVTAAARSSGCETTTSDTAVRTGPDRIRYPDVVVNCADDDLDAHVATAPTVLFEVTSPGTEWFDLNDKLDEYRALPSVRQILLISPTRVRVEVHSRSEGGQWSMRRVDDVDARIELPSIGARLALRDIYRALDPAPSRHLDVVDEDGSRRKPT